jgi:hypothetical protein
MNKAPYQQVQSTLKDLLQRAGILSEIHDA